MKTFHIYYAAASIPKDWDALVCHDIFLQSGYLEALEAASPKNIQNFYVGIFQDDELVGVAILQRVQLYVKDMFRNGGVSCFKEFIKDTVSKILKGNILVVGNLTHTGQHGVFFQKEKISQSAFLESIFDALEALRKTIRHKTGKKIRLILFKDYFEDDSIHVDEPLFRSKRFYKMKVQPNMIMPIRPNWKSGQDYVLEMNKKYRSRYKRARKKSEGIVKKELDLVDIKTNSIKLYKLYKNVSDNASFNTFILPENHFYSLKLNLKGHFKVFAYYLNEELIGFYTLILNNDALETYFLGYDKEHQYANQLYLNMLYDMVFFGIEHRFKSIVYARTAMEIKSSVGAQPEAMFMYLKHTNNILNAIFRLVFNLMNPSQKWEERHPFK